MNRTLIIIIGFITLSLIALVCSFIHAPRIESSIQQKAEHSLSSYPWLTIETNGRTLSLSGTSPSKEDKNKAIQLAKSITGLSELNHNIQFEDISLASLPEQTNNVSEPNVSTNPIFKTTINKTASKVTLSGAIPHGQDQASLIDQLKIAFPEQVIENQLTRHNKTPDNWSNHVAKAVTLLKNAPSGEISINENGIDPLTVPNIIEEKPAISNNELAVPVHKETTKDINSIPTKIAPEPLQALQQNKAESSECQNKFKQIVTENIIQFSLNSALIEPQKNRVFDKIIQFSNICPKSIILVSGHTDDSGHHGYNYLLSKQRAKSAVNELINLGISKNRFKIEGYGETKPLVENESVTGREKNRRIEFKYLTESE